MSASSNQISPLSDIRTQLAALLRSDMSDNDFVFWLSAHAKHAEEILRPVKHDIQPSIRDLKAAYRGFSNSQKVVDFCHSKGIILPKNEHWWAINDDNRPARIEGFDGKSDINGNRVDRSRGYPRITNGIDVYIERADGTLFLGHRDWLKWERKSKSNGSSSDSGAKAIAVSTKPTAKDVAIATQLVDRGDLSLFAEKYLASLQRPLGVKLSGKRDEDIKVVSSAVREYLDSMLTTI